MNLRDPKKSLENEKPKRSDHPVLEAVCGILLISGMVSVIALAEVAPPAGTTGGNTGVNRVPAGSSINTTAPAGASTSATSTTGTATGTSINTGSGTGFNSSVQSGAPADARFGNPSGISTPANGVNTTGSAFPNAAQPRAFPPGTSNSNNTTTVPFGATPTPGMNAPQFPNTRRQ
jgi:hypothetical protein